MNFIKTLMRTILYPFYISSLFLYQKEYRTAGQKFLLQNKRFFELFRTFNNKEEQLTFKQILKNIRVIVNLSLGKLDKEN